MREKGFNFISDEYGIMTELLISRCSEFTTPFYGFGYLLSGSKNFQLFTKTELPPGRYTIIIRHA